MSGKQQLAAAVIACALVSNACTDVSSRQTTAEALTAILTGDQRTSEERARDVYRHPKETLLFFGIRPEMSVLEVWPEPGYYSAIIAPLLREKGKYYAAVVPADPGNQHLTKRLQEYRDRLAARPDLYDRVAVVSFPT
ncbi:MAG TPA: hypothetical protein VED45_05925, partial [Steroidobacteraceae bacterium]|nr:hypothetical protein [Steroidobacteraceae bacterium]